MTYHLMCLLASETNGFELISGYGGIVWLILYVYPRSAGLIIYIFLYVVVFFSPFVLPNGQAPTFEFRSRLVSLVLLIFMTFWVSLSPRLSRGAFLCPLRPMLSTVRVSQLDSLHRESRSAKRVLSPEVRRECADC